MKLTEAEWAVMEILWRGERFSLSETVAALRPVKGWNKNTVFTYLTRMEHKGLVAIDRSHAKPYAAAITREDCAREERDDLLSRVYGGAAGDLIAAFLKESAISKDEVERLRKMLDDMEV
ncbi:MAG: BlaI/MecI/CopY family transcriptional regulator [Clostridia bacterium]|nr:BlaI/MecI/CopY family transcriptional regulator [Clostridia bacterium]